MIFKHTPGPWSHNPTTNNVESESTWLIEPNETEHEQGIKTQVISTFQAMGGENTTADIALICAAPELLELLDKITDNAKPGTSDNAPYTVTASLINEAKDFLLSLQNNQQ